MVLTLTPVMSPREEVSAAETAPAPRTIFANIELGGFNSANTSRGLLDPNKTMFINGTKGTAGVLTADGAIGLTMSTADAIAGSAFLSRRIYSETGFSARFEMRLGPRGSDASDGWAFVVAKDTNKIGGTANSIGYTGILNSFAFIYDTFYNSVKGQQNNSDYVPQVQKAQNGNYILATAENLNASGSYGSVLAFPGKGLGGAQNYSVFGWVDYDSEKQTMALYLSLAPGEGEDLTKPDTPISVFEGIDIEAVLGNQYYIGFTAASGRQQHILRQFYVFNESAPGVDFNDDGIGMNLSDGSGGSGGTSEIIEDYTPPTAPVVTQSENGMTDALMVFTVGGSEDINGVRKYQYRIGNETAWRDYAAGDEFVLDASLPVTAAIVPGGDVTVYARALDGGGNISSETAATLRYTIAPGPTLTAPADGSVNVFPANTPELIISFKSKIDVMTVGTVTVTDANGNPAPFARDEIIADDPRYDDTRGKLTLPFAPDAVGYGKTYTVTVSGFVNTSTLPMDPATETYTFSTIGRETMPNAGIDFTNERLTGLLNNVVYTINGTEYTASGGVIPIQTAWLGTNIRIVKPGTAATVDSAAQTLYIPARRNAPAVAQIPGYITGTVPEMEYSSSLTGTYSACAAGQTYVEDGVYYVRYKVGANEFKSATATIEVAAQTFTLNADGVSFDVISYRDAQPIAKNITVRSSGNTDATISSVISSDPAKFTIGGFGSVVPNGGSIDTWTVRPDANLDVGVHTATITFNYNDGRTATAQVSITVRETTPDIQIEYVNEQLTGLAQGAVYTVNGNSRTASTGKLNIENAWLGTEISIVKTNANTSLNSETQLLYVDSRPVPPSGVTATGEEFAGENNGILKGVTADMEYRRAGGAWTSGDGSDIENRAPGEYQVRNKAVAGMSFPSRAAALTIAASRNYKLTAEIGADPNGSEGKVTTGYLLVTFAHAYSANSGVPVAGLPVAASSTDHGAWVAGDASAGTIGDNGDTDDKTWRVNIYPAMPGGAGTATLTLNEWTAANGNTYTVINTVPNPNPASLTVYKVFPETQPNAIIDFENERLTNLNAGEKYKINGAERTADGSGYIPLGEFIPKANEDNPERSLRLVKAGGATSTDSPAQSPDITIPRRPATPEGNFEQPASKTGPNSTGSITLTNPAGGATYEYRSLDPLTGIMTSWNVSPSAVSGLSPGIYYARVKATGTSFASDSRSFHIRAFDSVDFGSVYAGYEVGAAGEEGDANKAVAQRVNVEENETITDVAWVDAGGALLDPGDVSALPFTLTGTGANRTVTPITGFGPKPDGSPYTARLKVTASALGVEDFTYRPVSLWVHPRAEIARVEELGTDTKHATNAISVTFKYPIELDYSDVMVDGAAVKTVGGFVSVSGDKTQYIVAVTPLMDHKDGDPINVRVNLGSDHLLTTYRFQNSNGESGVTDYVSVSIPRRMEDAEMVTPIPGYSTGYVQFTLDKEYCPIDTDAFEEAMAGIELKVNGDPVTLDRIYRVDADMGYTFRLRVTPTASGNMTLALPGFGIGEISLGNVTATGKKLTDNAFVLNENGSNYLTDPNDARQILQPVDASNGLTPVYEAPAFDLLVNREYSEWEVGEFYVDGKVYTGYVVSGGGALNQIFDGADDDSAGSQYPDLADCLKITLPAGWTDVDGAHTIHAVLTKGNENVLLFAKTNVTGLTPTYTLTVTGGTGGGSYPAGAAVRIQGTAYGTFLGWTQTAQTGEPGYIAALPRDAGGTVIMPAGDASLTALYASSSGNPSSSSSSGSAGDEDKDDENTDDEDGNNAGQGGAMPFEDIRESDWFYDDVAYVYLEGLMFGTDETLFGPNAPVTRGMLVTILGRRYGVDADEYKGDSFTDVDGAQYYAPYIKWAAENEIVLGVGDGRFAPDMRVSRQDFAVILYRYADFTGDGIRGAFATRIPFADTADISDYATEAIMWASRKGVVTGKPNNLFDPAGGATRAEAAAMLHRLFAPETE
jgi:hypothetical protein